HSGMAGGGGPPRFPVLRARIGRIEGAHTGHLIPRELHVAIPDARLRPTPATAHALGDFADRYPFAGETQPVRPTTEQLLIARTWEPSLEVVGISGAPLPEEAGNGWRPRTAVKLSIRVPPTADAAAAADAVERWLTADPPYGAHVTVRRGPAETGGDRPPEPP